MMEDTRGLGVSLANASDEELAEYRASDPYQQFPEDTEMEVVRAYFAAAEFESEAFVTEVGFVLDPSGWGFDIFDIESRLSSLQASPKSVLPTTSYGSKSCPTRACTSPLEDTWAKHHQERAN